MNVLIIKDDKPGHYNQSLGLLNSLEEAFGSIHCEFLEIKIQSKIARKLLTLLLNSLDGFFAQSKSLQLIPLFYKQFSAPKTKPDLIISTGGDTANINAWLSKIYNCQSIFNGRLRGQKEALYTFVTTVIDLGYSNQIILDVAPSQINQKSLKKAKEVFLSQHQLSSKEAFYALLIGGDGAGYRYTDEFYQNLIGFVQAKAKSDNIQWLITTSRRTPKHIELLLKQKLTTFCAYLVPYNQTREKVMLPFLALADKVFVTEESSSMISEAISALKPVYTLGVAGAKPDKNYQKILQKFEENCLISRIQPPFLDNANEASLSACKAEKVVNDEFMQKLKELMSMYD